MARPRILPTIEAETAIPSWRSSTTSFYLPVRGQRPRLAITASTISGR
ncbi:MAG TPA: hypothetical protein QGH28_03195 [Chloroflexota bacterium]|nr:hypothetical protein [Chloroflexota bacterium]